MLAVALLVVVAAPVGGVPGTTQAVWHVAAWELQVIMQFVVVEVCASRIFPRAADAPVGTVRRLPARQDRKYSSSAA